MMGLGVVMNTSTQSSNVSRRNIVLELTMRESLSSAGFNIFSRRMV